MGVITEENKFSFGEDGHVWVLWDAGEADEYGYEIEITGEDGIDGELTTIGSWSFGYENWSRSLWIQWGNYVSFRIAQCEGDVTKLNALGKELDSISCMYEKSHSDYNGVEAHLQDLDKIQSLISEVVKAGHIPPAEEESAVQATV